MNKTVIKKLNKMVEILEFNKKPLFPIMGGKASGEQTRLVTKEETGLLQRKGLPAPILVCLKRERELKELLW